MKRIPQRLRLSAISLLALVLLLGACANQNTYRTDDGPYRTVTAQPNRDTDAAIAHNRNGLAYLAADELDNAIEAFGKALQADVEFGPAHNNLGKVYYKQQDWYKAAWEFEYARKLMPNRAEPCNNLALVLERAGELDRAIELYEQAVARDEQNIEYRANLARALVRRGDRTERVRDLLEDLVENDKRAEWLIWAKQQLASFGK